VKPGPPRICECGECIVCKHRKHRYRYYQRNRERLIQLSAEYRRRRELLPHSSPTSRIDKDDDLDRKAAEWLEKRK
jgi:hypothetical protein